jgi:ABC-2 type transport system permease protein
MFYRIANLIYKELIQVSRDWLLIVVLIVAPVLQLSLLAWSTGRSVTDLPLAMLDMDHSAASRAIALELDNRKELALRYYATDMAQLTQWLDDGDADVGVIIPPHFERDLGSSTGGPEIQVIAGAANYIASGSGLSAAQQAISAYLDGRQASISASNVDLRTDIRYNPTLDSRQFTLPAMIGMVIFELTLLLAALGLAREREIGTLEQLIIMPFRRIEIIIGKAIPPLLIALADFPLMLFIAVLVFGTPMRGSLVLLVALTALFMTAEISWGLVLSTLARNQQQAMLFVFVEAITDITFSGFLVPVQNLPWFINIFSNVVPLRHYLVIIRSVMLKGATLDVLWPQVLALGALAIVIGAVAMFNLGRRLD